MRDSRLTHPLEGWAIWGRPLGFLLLFLLGPLFLFGTPLSWFAMTWLMLLTLGLWFFLVAIVIGGMVGSVPAVLGWVEWCIRLWVARFAPDAEALWLHWARHAHRPEMAHRCLGRAVVVGGAEACFQEGLIYLEGGFGAGGQAAAIERFRKAAALGHAEAAFHLAEALRTGNGSVQATASEAEIWYRRSASAGFGPAAAWLAKAYQDGDGVAADMEQAQHWREVSESLKPHPDRSRNLLRHDAAPEDPLVRMTAMAKFRLEKGADQLIARRAGRWALGVAAILLATLVIGAAGTFCWVGSPGLFHLPLIMLGPPVSILTWMAWRLRREGPRRGRDPLREAARRGDPEACFQIGLIHRKGGPHLPKDDLDAVLWFRKAAEAGHREAMSALAEAYLGGHGVVRDPREAARWAQAARRESTS